MEGILHDLCAHAALSAEQKLIQRQRGRDALPHHPGQALRPRPGRRRGGQKRRGHPHGGSLARAVDAGQDRPGPAAAGDLPDDRGGPHRSRPISERCLQRRTGTLERPPVHPGLRALDTARTGTGCRNTTLRCTMIYRLKEFKGT